MTITVALGSNPMWYIADLVGRPLGGGTISFFSSLDPSLEKLVYMDAAATTQYPIYFRSDSTILGGDFYYIIVRDSSGNTVWEINQFFPNGTGSGGGGATNLNFTNLIVNNTFINNLGTSVSGLPMYTKVAPGAHDALALSPTTYGTIYSPDIYFSKDFVGATDQITFNQFLYGDTSLNLTDTTPQYYATYVSNLVVGENFKDFIFPISAAVKNLEGKILNTSIWVQTITGASAITLKFLQYFGSGPGASPPVYTTIGSPAVTGSWAKYSNSFTVPSLAGKVPGPCGDSFIALVVSMPTGAACSINFTKASLYLGGLPLNDYLTNDQINATVQNPRTGDIRTSLNDFAPFGWVPMNDGTIGSPTSNATTRAALDTFPLYQLIWNQTNPNPTFAPIYDNTGAPSTRTDPITDYSANKQLSLTRTLGRVMAGTANPPVIRTYVATSPNILTLAPNDNTYFTGTPIVLSGGTPPAGLVNGTTYYVIRLTPANTISLATTAENAIANVPIAFPGSGSGTITLPAHAIGAYLGGTDAVLPLHSHTAHTVAPNIVSQILPPGGIYTQNPGSGTVEPNTVIVDPAGVSAVNQNFQPTVFYNIFVKL
jgi:hypothetical protein